MLISPHTASTRFAAILIAGLCTLTAIADVSIKPYFVREAGVVSLVVRTTNTGTATVNLPTEGYSLDVDEANGLNLSLTYDMPSFDHETETWSYVPSRQRLGIVDLRRGEHAIVHVPLNKSLARKMLDADARYDINYTVTSAFATRFSVWQGTATIKQQTSPYKENPEVVILKDDGVNSDEQSLAFLPGVSVPGIGINDKSAITVDPSTLPTVGEKITIRPAPNGSLRRRVTGEFGGFAGSMVTVGNRRYYILDIHPQDRQQFYDWSAYHRN